MGDFGFLSDTDESAVEELISQAQDLSVLEQLSKLNSSAFSDDSLLPPHLETRFRNLKSFPPILSQSNRIPHPQSSLSTSASLKEHHHRQNHTNIPSDAKPTLPELHRNEISSSSDRENLDSTHSKRGAFGSSDSWLRRVIPSPPREQFSGSNSSPDSTPSSPSPKPGCFWCSRKQRKKNRKKNPGKANIDCAFWVKEHEKILRNAFKEERKINEEAEKIIKWAKQASADRISFHGASDDSDTDVHRFAK